MAAAQQNRRVSAVIAYDEKAAKEARDEAGRQYSIQRSIRNWTAGAVFAASIHAAIAAYQACQMRKATIAASSAAKAASDQVGLMRDQGTLMHQQMVATYAPVIYFEPQLSEPTAKVPGKRDIYITLQNEGNGVCPSATIDFQFVLQGFPKGRILWKSKPDTRTAKEIPSRGNTEGRNSVEWTISGVASVERSDEVYSTQKKTTLIRGSYSWDNGFGNISSLWPAVEMAEAEAFCRATWRLE